MRVDPRAPPGAGCASRLPGPGSLSALTRRSCRFSDEGADPCTAETVLTGEIRDQSQLYGLLNCVRDFDPELVSVQSHAVTCPLRGLLGARRAPQCRWGAAGFRAPQLGDRLAGQRVIPDGRGVTAPRDLKPWHHLDRLQLGRCSVSPGVSDGDRGLWGVVDGGS